MNAPLITSFETDYRMSDYSYEDEANHMRNRVHWMTGQVTGNNILDVGCSQGLGAILLGREGHKVIAVDLDIDAIEHAQKALKSEAKLTQDNVTFGQNDFLSADYADESFSTVMMGHVLSSLVRPINFVTRAYRILVPQGRLIVTVPFGVHDDQNQKKSFYFNDMINILHPYFDVIEIQYFNGWTGFVGVRRDTILDDDDELSVSSDNVEKLEAAFHEVHRGQLGQVISMRQRVLDLTQKVTAQAEKLTERVSEISQLNDQLEAGRKIAVEREELHHIIEARVTDISLLGLSIESLEKDVAALKIEAEMAKKQSAVFELRLKQVHKSTSWRITAPLRSIILMLRRIQSK